jgi:hypothetical protein
VVPGLTALAQAASDLERRGYLRPGAPARSDAPVPFELAGWSADPAGNTEPDGSLSPWSLLWQERAVWALWTWSGIDLDEMRYESNPAFAEPVPDVPTAEVAGRSVSVRRLRVAHPDGQQVSIRTVVTAAADRKHWILDGDHAERAVRVSVNQLGERIQNLIQSIGTDIDSENFRTAGQAPIGCDKH